MAVDSYARILAVAAKTAADALSSVVTTVQGYANAAATSATSAATSATNSQTYSTQAQGYAAAAASVSRFYSTRAAGVAGTSVGDWFTSDEEGILKFYKHISGSPYYQDEGPVGSNGLYVTVEQFGATGVPGHNDQPAIQAAVNYAVANGIPEVRFSKQSYESWQVAFPGGSPNPWNGSHILITGDVALIGTVDGTTITLKNSTGGTRTKTDGTSSWWAGWLTYYGASVTKSILRDLTVEGGTTFTNVYSNSEANVSDKGICMVDWLAANLVTIDHRNITVRNFPGEIWYNGGAYPNLKIYVENLTLKGSPQSAFNPGSYAKMVAVNVDAGTAYLANEAIQGNGHTYIGCKFSDFGGGGCSFIATASNPGGYPYDYQFRDNTKVPPFTTFINTRFESGGHGGTILMCGWEIGNITTVDCTINMNYGSGDLRDVDLVIDSWCDQSSNFEAVSMNGPATTTTQVTGAPAGVYYAKPHNINLKVKCCRTALAQANSRQHATGVRFYGGLIDSASVRIQISGIAKTAYEVPFTPATGFGLPLITVRDFQTAQYLDGGQFMDFNDGSGNLLASKALDILWPAAQIEPANTGICNVTINTAYSYATGQRVRFIYNSNTNACISFARDGSGMRLKKNRSLRRRGEMLELEYRSEVGLWVEVAYNGDDGPYVLTDGATITPNFSAADNFDVTLAGNRTLANPSNVVVGQSGTIRVVQDATGSRTLAYGNLWKFPGGAPTLSTAANAIDVISYTVANNGLIYARLDKAFA